MSSEYKKGECTSKPTAGVLYACLLLCALALPFTVRPYAVTGVSMQPTFHEGEVVWVERISSLVYRWRGEVIVFRNPHQREVVDIKRIVGLPRETVDVDQSGVTITSDGTRTQFAEGTLIGGTRNDPKPFHMYLGPRDYLVLGDNRQQSSDSRSFGAVQPQDVIGHVFLRL